MIVTRDEHPELPFHVTHAVEAGATRTIGRFADGRDAEAYVARLHLLGLRVEGSATEAAIQAEVDRRLFDELERRGELRTLIQREDDEIAAAVAQGVQAELEKFFLLPIAEIERQAICAAVTRCGSREEAAKSLGMGVRTISGKLRSYGWLPRQKAG